jgi:hypothetical protein
LPEEKVHEVGIEWKSDIESRAQFRGGWNCVDVHCWPAKNRAPAAMTRCLSILDKLKATLSDPYAVRDHHSAES